MEENCMSLMPGTTLRDLDETDIETLIPWYLWKMEELKKPRKTKPKMKEVKAGEAAWVDNLF